MALLNRVEVDQLIELPKTISEPVNWKAEGTSNTRFKFEVTVACPEPHRPLRLRGFVGKHNFSYSVVSLQGQTLRRLNKHVGGHRNPDGSDMGPHHKHIWDDEHENRVSYVPDDIDWSDFNQALKDFLLECNIETLADIQTLRRQKELI